MLAKVLRIHWHDKQPVFSVDFDRNNSNRMVTAGGDNSIRVWKLTTTEEGEIQPEYCATLSRHLKSVNCVRFSHSGDTLASAGDGGAVILWKQGEPPIGQSRTIFGAASDDDDDDNGGGDGEHWTPIMMIRASDGEDIYDLAWSPDDRYLLFGLTDNTAQVWQLFPQKCIRILRDHQHFVQGVAWDPFNKFLITQSCDRSVKIWNCTRRKNESLQITPLHKLIKNDSGQHLFHDETLVSFFRRPAFSPEGSLVFLPAGMKDNCLYLLGRGQIGGMPISRIGGFERPVLGVRVNNRLFSPLPILTKPLFNLPYRIVYTVFTMDTVAIFDTRQSSPIVTCRDLHYGSLTDASWSPDGYTLILTSTDGFCSIIKLNESDLGPIMNETDQSQVINKVQMMITPKVQLTNIIPKTASFSSDPMDIDATNPDDLNSSVDPIVDPHGPVSLPDPSGPVDPVIPQALLSEVKPTEKKRIQPTLLSSNIFSGI